jgi:phage-related protein
VHEKKLNVWVNERKSMEIKMASHLITEISRLLVAIEELMQIEFSRNPNKFYLH